jgi:hypothetical protein
VKDRLNQLADRIRFDLVEIEVILRRAEEGWQLKIQKLVRDAPEVFEQVKAELLAFADFLYTAGH